MRVRETGEEKRLGGKMSFILHILSFRYLWNIQLKLVLEQGCPTELSAVIEMLFTSVSNMIVQLRNGIFHFNLSIDLNNHMSLMNCTVAQCSFIEYWLS